MTVIWLLQPKLIVPYARLRKWVKFVSHTAEPALLLYRFIGLHRYNTVNVHLGLLLIH